MMPVLDRLVHPPFSALEAFALGDADAKTRQRVAGHAATCDRCRATVQSLRDLRRALTDAPAPPMRADLLDRTRERVARFEVTLLPDVAAAHARPRRPWLVAAAAVVAGLAAVWSFFGRQQSLEAGLVAGDLSIAVPAPSAPRTLAARYRPASALAGAERLSLRATLYSGGNVGAPSGSSTFTLERQGNDQYAATVTLPSDAAFARFTVSSLDAQHVDDNDARGWEIVVNDSSGNPGFDGLFVRWAIHGLEDWEQSFNAAKDMVRYHPEQPTGLRFLLGGAMQLAGPAATDSVRRAFAPQIAAMHRRYERAPVTANIVSEMSLLSSQTGDTARLRFWRERGLREFPRSPEFGQQRVFMIMDARMTPEQEMAAYDRLWEETSGGAPQLLYAGFQLATRMGDSASLARWGERALAKPGWEMSAASAFVRVPSLRARGEALLRSSLGAMTPVSASDWEAALRGSNRAAPPSRAQSVLAMLGEALLADGNVSAAIDTLRRAASVGWNASILSQLGSAELRAGDTAHAARTFAWIVADPRTPAARADSLRARLGPGAQSPAWTAATADARQFIHDRALAETIRRRYDATARFADSSGNRRSIASVAGKGYAVVAFVSRNCAPSVIDLPNLQRLADHVTSATIPVIVLTEERPNGDVGAVLRQRGFTGTVWFDDRAEVSRAMRSYGTPQYAVVEDGTIRYLTRRATDVMLAMDALRGK